MSGLRALLFGGLFALVIVQYRQNEAFKAEVAALKAELAAAAASPQDQLKAALSQAGAGMDALKVVAGLQRVAQRFPQSPEGQAAARRAAEIEAALAKERAQAATAAQRARDKKDLETLLKLPPFDGSKAPPRDMTAAGCRALEENSVKYSGHRVTVTDEVENLSGYLTFTACSGVTISPDELGREGMATLKKRLGSASKGPLTLSGRFQGLDFYPDQVR